MTTRTRSQVPILPPLKTPQKHLSRSFEKPNVTPLALLRAGDAARHDRSSHVTSINHDLETRVSMLEQANKLLLEEIINTRSNNSHPPLSNEYTYDSSSFDHCDMGVARSNHGNDHILKQSSETDKRVHIIQNKLDRLIEIVQRTRDDTFVYHRDTHEELDRRIKNLEKRFCNLEDQYITLQTNSGDQKEVWSCQLEDLSASLSGQIKNGTKAVNELQRGLETIESIMHNLSGNMSQTDIVTAHLQALQTDTQHMIQSRLHEVWRTIRDIQLRITTIETRNESQDTWIKQSFNDMKDKMLKLSVSTTSGLKLVVSDLERLEKDLLSQTDMLEKSLTQFKKNTLVGNEKLIQEINQIHDQKPKDKSTVNDITMEITRTKETFEESKRHFIKSLSSLGKSITLIERENQLIRQELTKVLEAEIKTRREDGLSLQQHCTGMVERYGKAIECLKLSVATIENRTAENYNKLSDAVVMTNSEWREGHKQLLTDMGTKLSSLQVREQERDSLEERIENMNKQKEIETKRDKELDNERKRELEKSALIMDVVNIINKQLTKVAVDHQTQTQTDSSLSEINGKVTEHSSQLYGLARSIQEIQLKLTSQLQTESTKRFQEIIELRNELTWFTSRFSQYPTTAPVTSTHKHMVTVAEVTSPTPEPHSIQSSPSVAHKWKRSKRGRGTSHVMYAQEPTETMGTFTSAAPTPIELRNILGNEESDYLDTDIVDDEGVVDRQDVEGVVNRQDEQDLINRQDVEDVINRQDESLEDDEGVVNRQDVEGVVIEQEEESLEDGDNVANRQDEEGVVIEQTVENRKELGDVVNGEVWEQKRVCLLIGKITM